MLFTDAAAPRALYVLAHGAGAGMRHVFMERIAGALADQRISTARYEFPYMASGAKRPDPPAVAQDAVRRAVEEAARLRPELPIIAGGKSFGGRMTSRAAAAGMLPDVRGIVFLGFPLHPPKQPGTSRAEHLAGVPMPMLFVQGTRDDLADLHLLRPVIDRLGNAATLHVIEGADHSFSVLKRAGRTSDEVLTEIATVVATWMDSILGRNSA